MTPLTGNEEIAGSADPGIAGVRGFSQAAQARHEASLQAAELENNPTLPCAIRFVRKFATQS